MIEYSDERERTDTLLALAIAFTRQTGPGADPEGDEVRTSPFEALSPRDLLAGLSSQDSQAIELRLTEIERESPDDRMNWVTGTLARARASKSGEPTRLDQNIHPSQIVDKLQSEPAGIQLLVLHNLPAELAEPASLALGGAMRSNHSDATAGYAADNGDREAAAKESVVTVVRRSFLSNFASIDRLRKPAHLDLLSGVELARLLRLLGVRQTAIACRGIAEVETVASFLRRFSAEDARAIAMNMLGMEDIEPRWVEFAERLVQPEIDLGHEGAAMLDRIGLSLLAAALREREPEARRYTLQKLPVEAARELDAMLADQNLCADRQMTLALVRDIETIAENLRCLPQIANSTRSPATEPEIDDSLT